MEPQTAQQKPLPQPALAVAGGVGCRIAAAAENAEAPNEGMANPNPIPGGASAGRATDLLAEYDAQEGDRTKQMAWVNALPTEQRHAFAQALGARSFERLEERKRRERRR